MLLTLLQHTPAWVWGVLALLIALGLLQARDRELSLLRITVLPLVLVALSLSGVLSAFAHQPIALGGWASGLGAALVFGRHLLAVRGARWSAATRTLFVPGSWLPLVLIVGLFAIKYAVNVALAMHPTLAAEAPFAGWTGLAYGAFSGLFLARSLSLRSLATTRRDPLSCA